MADQEIWAYLPTARLFWNMSVEELELTQRHPVTPSFAEIARHTQELKVSTPVEEAEDEAAILKLAIRIASVEGFTPVTTAQEVQEIIDTRVPIDTGASTRWRKGVVIAAIAAMLLAIATGLALADALPKSIQDLIDRIDLSLEDPNPSRRSRSHASQPSKGSPAHDFEVRRLGAVDEDSPRFPASVPVRDGEADSPVDSEPTPADDETRSEDESQSAPEDESKETDADRSEQERVKERAAKERDREFEERLRDREKQKRSRQEPPRP